MDVRDSLDIETVSAALVTSGRPWRGVEFHPALGSTNTRLRELLTGSPPATSAYAVSPGDDDPGPWWVVLTDHQTGGRGRLGRAWTVPDRASLAVSVAVPVSDPAQAGWMPLLAGLALARAVAEVTEAAGRPLTSRLKWPNDVLLADDGDRKLSGILCELVTSGGGPAVVVVGTGVNIDQTRDELPVETATSLALAGATCAARTCSSPTSTTSRTSSRAPAGTATDARGRPAGRRRGRPTARRAPRSASRCAFTCRRAESRRAQRVAVDDDGGLVVRTAGGLRTFAAGDVVHVRAAAGGLA